MSYQISYHPEQDRQYPVHRQPGSKISRLILGIAAAGVFLFALSHIPHSEKTEELLEEFHRTYDFKIMTDSLREGSSLQDAFAAFCLNAMEHGNLK